MSAWGPLLEGLVLRPLDQDLCFSRAPGDSHVHTDCRTKELSRAPESLAYTTARAFCDSLSAPEATAQP